MTKILLLVLSIVLVFLSTSLLELNVAHADEVAAVADAGPVLAEPAAPTPDDPGSFFSKAYELFHTKAYLPLAGLMVLGLAWLVRKLPWDFLKTGKGGVVAALLSGLALELGTVMFAGRSPTMASLLSALVASLVASGIFSNTKTVAKAA